MKNLLFLVLFALAASVSATEIDRLLTQYRQIETVTCQIRRSVNGKLGDIQFISRVYWQNNDRLHVDNISPVPRRIIADGTQFFSYAEGDPKGFSRPVKELSETMLISLQKVPGTPMDHLLRLTTCGEQVLEPAEGLHRTAYTMEKQYVICTFDDQNRLIKIEFFDPGNHEKQTGTYHYSNYSEVLPGVWVPMLHRAEMKQAEDTFSETIQIDRFIVNQPVAESLFNPTSFFEKSVDFVPSFKEIYGDD